VGKTSAIAWIILTIGLAGVAMARFADKAAKPVLRDDAYHFSIGQMYDLHAYQHARMLLKFSEAGESVPAEVLKEHVSAIRANIAAAEKAFAKLGDMTKKDPAAAKKLAEIKQYNAKILKLCTMLEASNKNQVDSDVVLSNTRGIKEHLTAAYGASQDAADGANIFTEQWDQPGHGAFSD
jgi:hypothetical protein